MKKIFTLFIILFSIFVSFGQIGNNFSEKLLSQCIIENWTKNEGLPSNSLLDIIQTDDGYIWLSGYNGLIRFEGKDFTLFNTENTSVFKSDGIGEFATDNNGTLWFTTQSSGLISYESGQFVTHYTADSVKSLFSVLYIDKQNRIWGAASKYGWFVFENDKYTFLDNNENIEGVELSTIIEDENGVIWFATNGNGIFKYENSKFTNYTHEDGLISDWTNTLHYNAGLLWIGTDKGLCSFDGESFTEELQLRGLSVNDFIIDEYKNIWLGTRNGLFRKNANSKTYERLNSQNGLSKNYIIKLLFDNENSLWIINYRGGLSRLKNGKFICFTEKEGLLGSMVNTVCEVETDIVLVGFDNGLMVTIADNEIKRFETKRNLNGERIRHILKDSKGNLWISTYSGLLKVGADGNEKWFSVSDGFPDKYIRMTFEDSQKNIWVGTRNSGIIKLNDDGTFKIFDRNNGLNFNLIMSIDEDNNGNLLVGTSKGGLSIIKNDEIVAQYTEENGLTSNIVFGTYVDTDEKIWIAATNGLNYLENGKITVFKINNNELIDTPYDILEDNLGNFWLPCSKGVMKVQKQSLIDFAEGKITNINCLLYDKYDGLKQPECNATASYLKTTNGLLWFPTISGLAMLNPEDIPINTYIPPVYINNLIVDNLSVPLEDNLIIKSDKKRFVFEFNALSYYQPEENMYKFRLVGFEKNWNEATTENSISYTNLKPGNYTFKVIASNNDGIWNETGTEFSFKIKPYFYETIGFDIIILILLLALIFVIYKIRVKNLVRKQHKLEQIIKERTVEITNKNEELQNQNEEIKHQAEKLAKLSIVASNTKNVVIIFDEKYNLEWANNAYSEIYGEIKQNEISSKKINLLNISSNKNIESIIADCISNKKSITYTSKNINIQKEDIWVQTTLTPIFNQNELKNLVVIESDITELKKAHINISMQKKARDHVDSRGPWNHT